MRKSGWAKHLILALSLPVAVGAQTFKYWNVAADDTLKLAPAKLSLTGLYTGTTIQNKVKTLIGNAQPYEVNSALWSDGAHKLRWILLKSGTTVKYEELNDYWDYPDSAIFVKQFAIDTVPGDPTTRLLWETRLLINKEDIPDSSTMKKQDHWYGFTYKWNRDNKDALLVATAGADDSIKHFPNGISAAGMMKKWRYPSHKQCLECHRTEVADNLHGRSVLGFFTAQLNRPAPGNPSVNQLQDFFTKGVLSGTQSVWTSKSLPRWYAIEDTSASIDLRARSYIAANCSGCHGVRGMANNATFGVDFNYDFHTMGSQMEFRHRATRKSFGLDTLSPFYYPQTDLGNNPMAYDSLPIVPALVVPGYPEKSVLLFRQKARNTLPGDYDPESNQMPPLASFEVNTEAMTLITKWIKDWTPIPAPGAVGVRTWSVHAGLKGPSVQGHQLVLPVEWVGPGAIKASVTDITGRTLELRQISRNTFAMPNHLTRGVYVIKVNNKVYRRYLF